MRMHPAGLHTYILYARPLHPLSPRGRARVVWAKGIPAHSQRFVVCPRGGTAILFHQAGNLDKRKIMSTCRRMTTPCSLLTPTYPYLLWTVISQYKRCMILKEKRMGRRCTNSKQCLLNLHQIYRHISASERDTPN